MGIDVNNLLNSSEIPDWFLHEVKTISDSIQNQSLDTTSLLSSSRNEFYNALSTFYGQVKYLISIYLAQFSVVLGLIGLAQKTNEGQPLLLLGCGGGLLILGSLILIWAIRIMSAQYKLYVAALVYSTQIHLAAGIATHRWFVWVIQLLKRTPKDVNELARFYMNDKESTYQSYLKLMIVATVVSAVTGAVLLVIALSSL